MAKIEIRFKCSVNQEDYITVEIANDNEIEISTYIHDLGSNYDIVLDKSTAIKFAKTVRTEINKIKK